jgi:hypothetical protein
MFEDRQADTWTLTCKDGGRKDQRVFAVEGPSAEGLSVQSGDTIYTCCEVHDFASIAAQSDICKDAQCDARVSPTWLGTGLPSPTPAHHGDITQPIESAGPFLVVLSHVLTVTSCACTLSVMCPYLPS